MPGLAISFFSVPPRILSSDPDWQQSVNPSSSQVSLVFNSRFVVGSSKLTVSVSLVQATVKDKIVNDTA